MSQVNTYSVQAITTATINPPVDEQSFSPLSKEENRHGAFPLTLTTDNSVADRLAADLNLFQFVLSESEATFTGPVRHFFNPGGQQFQFNQN